MPPVCTEAEQDYLCAFASGYFRQAVTRDDIVWTYSGVRPLYDDGASSATAATREYTLKLDDEGGAPILNVFGGKITTYRKLAESAMEHIARVFPQTAVRGPQACPCPAAIFRWTGLRTLTERLRDDYAFLDRPLGQPPDPRLRDRGAGMCWATQRRSGDLGQDFGATLTEREVTWLMQREFARQADDILWRRSKLGLRLSKEQADALERWMLAAVQVQK